MVKLTTEQLASRLGSERSNTIGEQLWCVIGARESYARAARAGAWEGFSCALASDRTTDRDEILRLLELTRHEVLNAVGTSDELTSARLPFLLDLLEHESQHHGQLIRYLYALGIERPPSWRGRYALD